jgi:hypothetical protein
MFAGRLKLRTQLAGALPLLPRPRGDWASPLLGSLSHVDRESRSVPR